MDRDTLSQTGRPACPSFVSNELRRTSASERAYWDMLSLCSPPANPRQAIVNTTLDHTPIGLAIAHKRPGMKDALYVPIEGAAQNIYEQKL